MALKRASKKKIITKHRLHDGDTGSPSVQVAILTKEIDQVTKHLRDHKKDNSARRGLIAKVSRRRKLLSYLRMNKTDEYQKVIDALDLKK
ncbi:30S ribosomal protein S15 [Candidatus Peribacteria bacterium RIFCSPLOWO2_01_FULL_51_18]|nr:MAG: 30S ribosomal protein S15 [Candidatus Peribacteria bacterium RIFCSPHIGHO2_02_FULL_51_15]OGJ66298.1 MAG: 30S ribosomal protein S15 [Candidatus Peribacteria bacterium RIFCSPLOWO2_01_FULL_51_18]